MPESWMNPTRKVGTCKHDVGLKSPCEACRLEVQEDRIWRELARLAEVRRRELERETARLLHG